MLNKNPKERPSAEEVLNHPWLIIEDDVDDDVART